MPHYNFVFSKKRGRNFVPLLVGILVMTLAVAANGQSQPDSTNFTYLSSFTGITANDLAGWDVALVGDVNKDGFGDLLIGTPENNKGGLRSGAAYLIFGSANMPPLLTPLTKADVTLLGVKSKDEAGMKVAGVGDVNGDGFSDFIIAAPMENNGAGKIYLIFGKSTGWKSELKLDDANVIFAGEKWGDNAGFAIANAGDVNNDGLNDFIIGAPRNDSKGNEAGKAYLILGKKSGWQTNISLAKADVVFEGESLLDLFGSSVAGIGDLNNDGYDDVAIGAPFHNDINKKDVGKVYIFFGKETFNPKIGAAMANASLVGKAAKDQLGKQISNSGDFNGDAIDDFLVSASLTDSSGKIYLIAGKATGWSKNAIPEDFAPSFIGEKSGDFAGLSMQIADLNNDGFSELLIGASKNNQSARQAGKVYLIRGKASGWSQNDSLSKAKVFMPGEKAHDYAGHALAAGNFDNDGYLDVVVSAPGSDTSGIDAGIVYLFHSPFKIAPASLTLISPNGGENWTAGSQQLVRWAATGKIENVKLKYSTDNGASWKLIIETTPNDGEYNWTVPDDPSTTCLLLVEDASDGKPSDKSEQVFTISKPALASLKLTGPNGGENWLFGSEHQITWTSIGKIEHVKLSYSTDNGATWKIIISSTSNDGSYKWTIPNDLSASCLVKVEDAIDGDPCDQSDQVFTISQPPLPETLTISSPNGGEQWIVGTQHQITWSWSGAIAEVKIEYSINNRTSWNLIDGCTPNDGVFDWIIPNTPSSNCLVKISDKTDGIPVDVSDAVFSIILPPKSITVTSPNGSECWHSDTKHEIKWNSTGLIGNVKIQYSIDGGSHWVGIINSTPNNGVYLWTVPNVHSKNCLIKVADVDGSPEDVSDFPFTIWNKAPITVIAPNGGECLQADQDFEIKWEACCCLDSVKIQYSIDGGKDWTTIAYGTENDNSYNWKVPKVHSTNCLVKVADLDCDPEDVSNAPFTIWGKAPITIISPNGGECLKPSQQFKIKWEASCCIDSVKIHYSVDGGNHWTMITKSTPNDSSYLWTVPAVHSTNCLVKVADRDGDPEDISDSPFTIWNKAPITVLSPNGGECLHAGQQFEIKWEAICYLNSLKIQYSINGGKEWKTIVNGTENDGKYLWTVPKVHSDSCLIKVADLDCDPEDVSNSRFTIWGKAPVTVLYPNGGECFKPGDKVKIKWEACCCLDSLKIQYSTDGGKDWTMIIYGTENDGSFLWTVPDVHSSNCLIKVADLDCDPEDFSNKPFTIWGKAPITVISPNGGECLHPGQKYMIKWQACCCLDSLKIQYSINNGKDWKMIVSGTPNDSSYLWTVPNVHSTQCLIKVADLDCDPEDVSDKTFAIWNKAPITVISPNGGECLVAGQQFNIKWEACCCFDSLKIQYSTDGGKDWNTIVYGTPNDSSFQWTVPAVNSKNCLIKVADLDCDPFDVSDKPFTICAPPFVTVLQPNGGEYLQVGTQYQIKWYACCFIDTVKIQYSIDKGKNWQTIIGKTENDSSFIWTIPNTPSDSCLIKVADLDCDPFDVSDNIFSIRPAPVWRVIQPNGGEVLTAGTDFEIKWISSGYQIDSVKIQYSIDGGNNWLSVIYRTANDGSYVWKVPNTPSDSCLVKVADVDCDPADVSDGCFIIKPVVVTNFDAAVMTGCAPLQVKFSNLSTENALRWRWSFGDGKFSDEKEPVYTYSLPGIYTVKLIAYYRFQVDSLIKVDFIRAHQQESFARLAVTSASPTLPQQDCSKATDGDMYGWDGTVVLQGEQPHIIFSLNNAANKAINSLGLITDTGIGFEDRWIRHFQVQISTTGTEASDFQTVLDTTMTTGAFEVFAIRPVAAKFIKLVVLDPKKGLVQLGEFEAYLTEAGPTDLVDQLTNTPTKFKLAQNYPNPFNPSTTIRFELPQATEVKLEIYNVLGENIRTLFDGKRDAGFYEMIWDGKNNDGVTMPSGVYLYLFATNEYREVRKMILAK